MTTETRNALKTSATGNIKDKVSSEQLTLGTVMLLVGVLLIFAVGFAQGAGGFLHNAAHDTRHAVTIPCH
ncbi:CbtB-domain containing protein [Deltaproteobacteria bacterium]|nr:CbtB-domain containing protein [Deltaproteobacteria bacterium]